MLVVAFLNSEILNTNFNCVQKLLGQMMDQRIESTHVALQGGMRTLLGQTTWDKITVRSLCATAGVSRTTFYSHFKHKDDLLDSLLMTFEQAMLSENNNRSLTGSGAFKFLPMLLNHVNGNRKLFANTNSSIEGYAVAVRFVTLIGRLVESEINELPESQAVKKSTRQFVAGGIYQSLVDWSKNSADDTHLSILNEIDQSVRQLLTSQIQQSKRI